FLLAAASADAATFLVANDRDLVAGAKTIVVATDGESSRGRAPGGWLEEVTALRVDQAIKGSIVGGKRSYVLDVRGVGGATSWGGGGGDPQSCGRPHGIGPPSGGSEGGRYRLGAILRAADLGVVPSATGTRHTGRPWPPHDRLVLVIRRRRLAKPGKPVQHGR